MRRPRPTGRASGAASAASTEKTKHPGVKLECQVLCKSFKVLPKTFQDPSQGQKMPFMVTSVRTPRVYTAKVPFSLTEKMFPMDKWIRGQDDKLIK